jgi:type IV secretory pathway TrbL component
MNLSQKLAVVAFRIFAMVLLVIGILSMFNGQLGHALNISGVGQKIAFVMMIAGMCLLPGLVLLLISKPLGRWAGRDLD